MTQPGNTSRAAIAPEAQPLHFGQRLTGSSHIFTSVLFAVFVTVLLIAIIVGTNVYRVLYMEGQRTSAQRLDTALLANIVKSNDAEGAFAQTEGPQGPVLLMLEFADAGDFETRIYQYDGNIVQEYARGGSELNPERASVIGRSDVFDFHLDGDLLTISTDEGEVNVALRSDTKREF